MKNRIDLFEASGPLSLGLIQSLLLTLVSVTFVFTARGAGPAAGVVGANDEFGFDERVSSYFSNHLAIGHSGNSVAPVLVNAADVTSTWSAGSGNWSNAANWSPNTFFPNNGNGGLSYDAVLSNGGTITLDQNIVIEKFTLTAGTLTGTTAFTLTLNDLFTWGSATISGLGTLQANGGMTLNASTHVLNSHTVNNGGAANWTVGNIDSGNGAIFNNQSTGTFTTNFDGQFVSNQGGATTQFNNAGTFTKSAGAGTTNFTTSFNNTGTVIGNSGTIALNGGGTSTGSFEAGSGGAIIFGDGTHVLNAGSSISGSGTIGVGGGATWNFSGGTYNV